MQKKGLELTNLFVKIFSARTTGEHESHGTVFADTGRLQLEQLLTKLEFKNF